MAVSAVTVGVVAVQLVDTINKLLNFWKSIEDVPEDLDAIRDDLGYCSCRLFSALIVCNGCERACLLQTLYNNASKRPNGS